MNKKCAEQAIKRIAKQHGITEEEVLKDIRSAIFIAYMNHNTSQIWEEIFGKDTLPSPEEFISKVAFKCCSKC